MSNSLVMHMQAHGEPRPGCMMEQAGHVWAAARDLNCLPQQFFAPHPHSNAGPHLQLECLCALLSRSGVHLPLLQGERPFAPLQPLKRHVCPGSAAADLWQVGWAGLHLISHQYQRY